MSDDLRALAKTKAHLLWAQSRAFPLDKYLEDWKAGREQGSARYVLEVIWAYDDLLKHAKR